MKENYHKIQSGFILMLGLLLLGSLNSCNQNEQPLNEWSPRIGGCGGMFFNAPKGPLVIEIEKEDLNVTNNMTAMRVIFTGPDRKVIDDLWIPDDGLSQSEGTGPGQSVRLETNVTQPGVYAVMLTVSHDRYGDYINWRFRTNCEKYMVETSRGHRDAQHEEPIVLRDPEREADICFLPQSKAFNLRVTNLVDSVESLELSDVNNNQIAIIHANSDTITHTFEEGNRIATPWKLHFKNAQAKVEIEGVTQWNTEHESEFFSVYPDAALWTPDAESWFQIHENRWLITPYNRNAYVQQGEDNTVSYKIHNNGKEPIDVDLSLEFPKKKWEVNLSESKIKVNPNEEKEVTLSWKGLSEDKVVHLYAKTKDYNTYSTLYANSGELPVKSKIDLPLVLKPYQHEHEQYGYSPDYPLDNQVYFDNNNVPFVITEEGIASLKNGTWETTRVDSIRGSIIAFDSDNDVYAIATKNNQPVLIQSRDDGKTFSSYEMPRAKQNSSFDIEQFLGHNIPDGPPPVMRYTRTGIDRNIFWRRYGDLELLVSSKTEEGIEWADPILISKNCLGVSSHSGIPSSIVSRGSKIFMVWGEVSDPEASREEIPGVPVYVNSYDKETGVLGKPVLVGFGAPPNDVHNIPAITIDGNGYLHVLTGTHGRPFHYARSLEPDNVHAGWTKAEPVMEGDRSTQTYIGLVTGTDNTLHLVFRLWRYNTDYFPNNYFASLAYMSKTFDGSWTEPRLLVVAPFSHYSVYRHRLTTDRKGGIFISYYYWSTYWFYRTDRKGNQRTLLMSPDGGQNFKLADSDDLL